MRRRKTTAVERPRDLSDPRQNPLAQLQERKVKTLNVMGTEFPLQDVKTWGELPNGRGIFLGTQAGARHEWELPNPERIRAVLQGIDNQMFGKLTPAEEARCKRALEDTDTGTVFPPYDPNRKWPWGLTQTRRRTKPTNP